MNRILGDRTGRMRERLLSARLGNLDRQNERLRNEVSVLHSQLDHEREEHEELRDALRSKPKEVKVRKSGFVRKPELEFPDVLRDFLRFGDQLQARNLLLLLGIGS